jgi:hypothetical protein
MRLKQTILLITILCAGCVSTPHAPQPSPTVAGLKPASRRATYTSEQIVQLYLTNIAFGDWYLARLGAACDALAHDATTPEARYQALRLKAIQGASVYSILTNPNPIVQVLSLQSLIELTRLKWITEGKAAATFGDQAKLLVDALNEIEQHGRSKALEVISPDELNSIRDSAQAWRSQNREIDDIEFIRFEDYAAELAHSLAQQQQADLVSNVQSAISGLSETRLLGVRSLYLMSRFPRIIEWQMEAEMAYAARQPETKSFLDDMTRMTRTADELQQQTAQLQKTLDSLPQKVADSLTSEPVLKEALATAHEGVARGGAATTQLAAVETSVRQLDGAVDSLSRQFNQINRSYDPESVQKMVQEGKSAASQEARSLIYLATLCLAGLIVLQALLRRWRSRNVDERS